MMTGEHDAATSPPRPRDPSIDPGQRRRARRAAPTAASSPAPATAQSRPADTHRRRPGCRRTVPTRPDHRHRPPAGRPAPAAHRARPGRLAAAGRRRRRRARSRCRRTGSSTASCPGSTSTPGCWPSPRTRRTPLLERAKFLAIFASNLDEFYMVRVAGLKRRLQTGLPVRGGDRLPAAHPARAGRREDRRPGGPARRLLRRRGPAQARPPRASSSCAGTTSTTEERERLRTYFREQIFPVLTPLAVDPAHPFPYISGLSLNLAVVGARPGRRPGAVRPGQGAQQRAPVRPGRPRTAGVRFLPVEELIAAHLGQLFSGMQVVERHLFRVTRNAEVEVDEDRDEDLLQALERELARRRFGPPVRLEVAASISDHVLDLLVRELDMDDQDVHAGARACSTCPRCGRSTTRPTGPTSRTGRSCRRPTRGSPRARCRAASSPSCATATSWCTTRTTRSRPACSASSSRPPPTRTCWPSSRPSTAPAATPRSSTRWSTRPPPASRWWCWSR